jgi:hypothetical protein
MGLADPDNVSALAGLLGVTVARCRRVLSAARRRNPDCVKAQLRQVVVVLVEDPDEADELMVTLGVQRTDTPEPEPVSEPIKPWLTPPMMPKKLLADIPRKRVEEALGFREEMFNAEDSDLARALRIRGFADAGQLTRTQVVDLITWVDYMDVERVNDQLGE